MAERGVPILGALVKLAANYGNEISKEDVYKAAEKGQISFKAVSEALGLMTSEGGIFHKQMEKQSKTLFGLLSTVKDNVFNVTAVIGDSIEEPSGSKPGCGTSSRGSRTSMSTSSSRLPNRWGPRRRSPPRSPTFRQCTRGSNRRSAIR